MAAPFGAVIRVYHPRPMSETSLRSLRLALASLLGVALVGRLAVGMSRSQAPPTEFFGSFTVLSNMLAIAMLSMYAIRPALGGSMRFAVFRGLVTVSMVMTVILFVWVKASPGIVPGATEPWVDWSLRVVGPAAVLADWLAHPPTARLGVRSGVSWTVPPVLYLGYALVRGAINDSYPYPFLDPAEVGGYGRMAIWSGAVVGATLIVALGCSWWAQKRTAGTKTA